MSLLNFKQVFNIFLIALISLSYSCEALIIPQEHYRSISTALFIDNGRVLYVGGLGSGNFSSINEAVSEAQDGDTIYVYNGIYYEQIKIRKSITLIGEEKNSTVIDASIFPGNPFAITIYMADRITISGFTIGSASLHGDRGISITSNFNIITNNIIYSTIQSRRTYGNIIKGNIIGDEYGSWMLLTETSNSTISSNILKNDGGIYLSSFSNNNIIADNHFYNGSLHIFESYRNTVTGNTVNSLPILYIENQSDGLIEESVGQIILVSCDNFTIKNLNLMNVAGIQLLNTNNSKIIGINMSNCGSCISLEHSNRNTILECTLINNSGGIYIGKSNSNNITLNHVINNSGTGISLFLAKENTILNNIISHNRIGISIDSFPLAISFSELISIISSNNLILKNDISFNNEYGIYIQYICLSNKITCNNFQKNSCHASFICLYLPMYNYWDKNYWDDWNNNRPKCIKGTLTSMYFIDGSRYAWTWYFFDWHPAQEPYDIP